jgi:hypothetical protein
MKSFVVALVFTAGCMVGPDGPGTGGGGGGGGGGDGDGMGSGSGSGSGMATVDGGGMLPACTNAIYDPCTDAAQCMSNQCQLFNGGGIQVCTQTCTPGDNTTCPQQNGQPAQCNNMGTCRPPAANSCMR